MSVNRINKIKKTIEALRDEKYKIELIGAFEINSKDLDYCPFTLHYFFNSVNKFFARSGEVAVKITPINIIAKTAIFRISVPTMDPNCVLSFEISAEAA